MSTLRYGTCSWKFPSWNGLVYSQADGINYLEEYARRYQTVEIDQWFWSLFDTDTIGLPKTETVCEYRASVPSDFRFTIKAPNSVTLTHFYTRGAQKGSGPNPYFLSVPLFRDFLQKIEPMKDQTATVMLQFEYLNKQKMPSLSVFLEKLDAFLDRLSADPACAGWPLSVELRNPNFLTGDYFDFLRSRGVSNVFCHGYFLPPVAEIYRRNTGTLVNPSVVRLLGPDRSGIEKLAGKKWSAVVAPKDEELPVIADMIVEMVASGVDVYVNVNNHYEGSAPLTIEKLERLVDQRRK